MQNETFQLIYNEHFPKVYRLCLGYFNGDTTTATDATQEIFIKVWEQHDRFRNESAIGTWIYRIAVNTCLLHLRKASVRKEIKTDTLPERADEVYDHNQEKRLQKMYACIQQLDETSRLIILMVLDQLSYESIASITGITADTLRVKIHRIKKSLTQCVQL